MRTIEGEVLAIAPMMRADDGEALYLGKPLLVKAENAYGCAIQVKGRMVLPEQAEYDMLVAPLGVVPPSDTCLGCGTAVRAQRLWLLRYCVCDALKR